MSSIPPNMNVAASLAQSHVSQNESAKSQDAQRNKQAADARQLSRLAEQQQDEVETTEEAEHLRVHREGEGQEGGGREPQERQDNPEDEDEPLALYDAKGTARKSDKSESEQAGSGHIDLSA